MTATILTAVVGLAACAGLKGAQGSRAGEASRGGQLAVRGHPSHPAREALLPAEHGARQPSPPLELNRKRPLLRRLLPPSFVAAALCVHDGWHYRLSNAREATYVIEQRGYARTWNVPDSIKGGTGEAGDWHIHNDYEGGMQFASGTWDSAVGRAWERWRVRLPSAAYLASPYEQLLGAFVTQQAAGWGQWPQTARACGL